MNNVKYHSVCKYIQKYTSRQASSYPQRIIKTGTLHNEMVASCWDGRTLRWYDLVRPSMQCRALRWYELVRLGPSMQCRELEVYRELCSLRVRTERVHRDRKSLLFLYKLNRKYRKFWVHGRYYHLLQLAHFFWWDVIIIARYNN